MNICKTRKGPDTGQHAKHTNGNNIKKKKEQIGVKSDTLYHLLGIHRATLLLEDNISFILIMQY